MPTTSTAQWAGTTHYSGINVCPTCGEEGPEWGQFDEARPDTDCIACLRAKAAAFDVLSERIATAKWLIVTDGPSNSLLIYIQTSGERVYAPTLAEAVRLAMEAEGER